MVVREDENSVPANSSTNLLQPCDVDETAVGGGGGFIDPNTHDGELQDLGLEVVASVPSHRTFSQYLPDGTTGPQGWAISVLNSTGSAVNARVYALCASP